MGRIVSVPLAYVLSHVLKLGLGSVWVAMPVSAVVASVTSITWITMRLRRLERESVNKGADAAPQQGERE